MTLQELLKVRDTAIKARLLAALSQDNAELIKGVRTVLDAAFTRGEEDWQGTYIGAIFSSRADEVRKGIKERPL